MDSNKRFEKVKQTFANVIYYGAIPLMIVLAVSSMFGGDDTFDEFDKRV